MWRQTIYNLHLENETLDSLSISTSIKQGVFPDGMPRNPKHLSGLAAGEPVVVHKGIEGPRVHVGQRVQAHPRHGAEHALHSVLEDIIYSANQENMLFLGTQHKITMLLYNSSAL